MQTRLLMYTCPFSYNILTRQGLFVSKRLPIWKKIYFPINILVLRHLPLILTLYFVVYLFVYYYYFFVAQIAALQEQVRLLQSAQACILHICVFCEQSNLSLQLTSSYRHLSIMDSSFGPRNAKNHTFPTSIIRTPL